MPHTNNISETTKTYYFGDTDLTNRGYTGHEHLPDYQLINMNGRMYDPITKQMTSPDILDQSSYFTQSYNRYSYALNNPMSYMDPTGYVEIGHRESSPHPPMNSHGASFDDYFNWIKMQVMCGYNPMDDYYYIITSNNSSALTGGWSNGGISSSTQGDGGEKEGDGGVSVVSGSSWIMDFTSVRIYVTYSDLNISSVKSIYTGVSITEYEQVEFVQTSVDGDNLYFTIYGTESQTIGFDKFGIHFISDITIYGYVDTSTNTLYVNLSNTGYWFHNNDYYPAN